MGKQAPSEIFGIDTPLDQCEILAFKHISENLRQAEVELYASKWFDYRMVHPTIATYHFAAEYRAAYRCAMMRSRDAVTGRYQLGFKGKDIFQGKEITGFWKARQAADALGIRYDFFLRTVMRLAEESNWKRFPRPTHLYSADFLAFVQQKWEEECKCRLQSAQSAHYLAALFTGLPEQRGYQEWMTQQVSKRQHKEFGVNFYMVQQKHMLEETAVRAFGEGIVKQSLEIVVN